MAYRRFVFHKGGGSLEYDQEAVHGLVYGDQKQGATLKDVSNAIYALIRSGEWCPRCDLELPEPVYSATIEASVLKAVRRGQMNLVGLPWSVIAGRLQAESCPGCGSLMSRRMIDSELLS